MKVFLSYRRDDTLAVAGRIFDRLCAHYGYPAVYMDIDAIPPGVDFRRHINEAIRQSDILLALIGNQWLGPLDKETRRLAEPGDFVRIEIEAAFNRDVPVVPVLIGRAQMPGEYQLPPSLAELAYRNAYIVDPGRDFHSHMDRLITWLDRLFTETKGSHTSSTAVASVAGNVVIPSPDSVNRAMTQLPEGPSLPVASGADMTDVIEVLVCSRQFGRRTKLRVPHDITAKAFIELLVRLFRLPRLREVDEVGLSLLFEYSVGKRVNDSDGGSFYSDGHTTLRSMGICDGGEVNLGIHVNFWDAQLGTIVRDPFCCYAYPPPKPSPEVADAMDNFLRGHGQPDAFIRESLPQLLVSLWERPAKKPWWKFW